MPDYRNGKIYKITDGVGVYIGSTTVPLSQRFAQHKNSKRQYEKGNRKRKCSSYEVLNDDSTISLLEDFPCERKEQLLSRERYFIETMNCINKKNPIRQLVDIEITQKHFEDTGTIINDNIYHSTTIYKIVCRDENNKLFYVGHTTNLKSRAQTHKQRSNNDDPSKLYQHIKENGGWDNFQVVEIERIKCENITEAKKRELFWIKELEAELNSNVPMQTIQEWNQQNKERMREWRLKYNRENYDRLKQYKRDHYENNPDKKNIRMEQNRMYALKRYNEIKDSEEFKQKRKANRKPRSEEEKNKRREEYLANKDAINARRRELAEQKKNKL
jgi:predicted GIY-YIG superfamily endonuclease